MRSSLLPRLPSLSKRRFALCCQWGSSKTTPKSGLPSPMPSRPSPAGTSPKPGPIYLTSSWRFVFGLRNENSLILIQGVSHQLTDNKAPDFQPINKSFEAPFWAVSLSSDHTIIKPLYCAALGTTGELFLSDYKVRQSTSKRGSVHPSVRYVFSFTLFKRCFDAPGAVFWPCSRCSESLHCASLLLYCTVLCCSRIREPNTLSRCRH